MSEPISKSEEHRINQLYQVIDDVALIKQKLFNGYSEKIQQNTDDINEIQKDVKLISTSLVEHNAKEETDRKILNGLCGLAVSGLIGLLSFVLLNYDDLSIIDTKREKQFRAEITQTLKQLTSESNAMKYEIKRLNNFDGN